MNILNKLKLELKAAVEAGYTEEQWKELDEKTKKEYIKNHPHSKYAQQDNPVKPEKSKEYDDGSMTSKEAKEYWKNYHDSDPVLEMYDSFEEWYKESKQNGYIKDEVVEKEHTVNESERPTSYFNGELEIESWDDQPSGGYSTDEASYIGQGIQDRLGIDNLDIKYADNGTSNFVSILDEKTGTIYNVVIDEYGIDIMDEDMSTSYAVDETENGYFEPDDLDSVVDFLEREISGGNKSSDNSESYDSEDDYGDSEF